MRLIVQISDKYGTSDDQFVETKKLSSPKKQTSSPEKARVVRKSDEYFEATNSLKEDE